MRILRQQLKGAMGRKSSVVVSSVTSTTQLAPTNLWIDPIIRWQILNHMMRFAKEAYCRTLEQYVFRMAYNNPLLYQGVMIKLTVALRRNGDHLQQIYAPEDLPSLDIAHLVGNNVDDTVSRKTKLRALVETLLTPLTTNDGNSTLKCKCGSTDVAFEFKQTRSADEPMTMFCACRVCNKRWKMS